MPDPDTLTDAQLQAVLDPAAPDGLPQLVARPVQGRHGIDPVLFVWEPGPALALALPPPQTGNCPPGLGLGLRRRPPPGPL